MLLVGVGICFTVRRMLLEDTSSRHDASGALAVQDRVYLVSHMELRHRPEPFCRQTRFKNEYMELVWIERKLDSVRELGLSFVHDLSTVPQRWD